MEIKELLVKFGNYLLSEERENNLINEQNKRSVTDADLSRFNDFIELLEMPELISLLTSYFYPTTPPSNSDEMFKKRMRIIKMLNDRNS